MTIKQFLTTHVEGYLFQDLHTMSNVKLRMGQKLGGVGYPMMTSILAGMELLGGLLQQSTFNTSEGFSYFNNYWDNYLAINTPKYKPFGIAFRKLVRNGIAHTYLAKTGIWIYKGDPAFHLVVSTEMGNFYLMIEVGELLNDFISSYNSLVRPIVWNKLPNGAITINVMENRLNEMINKYEIESNEELANITLLNTNPPSTLKAILSGISTSVASGVTSGTVTTYSGTRIKKN